MTIKKDSILKNALELFAHEGYDATSTNKIAKKAGVSEGLIFRHFKNKEGLLNAILEKAQEDSKSVLLQLECTPSPKERLAIFIVMAFDLDKEQKTFWKLVYALKWQAEIYDNRISAPFKKLMSKTFKELAYQNPNAEAEALLMLTDGIMTGVLLKKLRNTTAIKKALLNKYDINI